MSTVTFSHSQAEQMITTFFPNLAAMKPHFSSPPSLLPAPAPRLPLGGLSWAPGLRNWCSPCVLALEKAGPGRESAGKMETLQRQMHFIDKATALYRAEAETPSGQGHIGGGGVIHIETQAQVSLILLMGQQGDNSEKEGRGL